MKPRRQQQLHAVAQRAYVGAGLLTANMRERPGFIIIGASRSGTTSLFKSLSLHPEVRRPRVNKGVRYFDLNYDRPWSWYRAHFPLKNLELPSIGHSREKSSITFEASGYYLFHPFAIQRLAMKLPKVKIVVMLRDPVERAYSGWKHERSRGYESQDFETALSLEDERLRGEYERMRYDSTYVSYCHHHLAHRSRGEYATQLGRVFEVFPERQVHVIISEEFFERPAAEFLSLTTFLGLKTWLPEEFPHHNAEPGNSMSPQVRTELRAHYAPQVQELERMLDRSITWPYRTGSLNEGNATQAWAR